MSRILKRPMFRTGGSTNEGIMHGLVNRKGYADGPTQAEIYGKEYEDIFSKIKPPAPRLPLGQIGLNLVSGEFAGDGFLSNVARSAKGPYEKWTARDDARSDIDYQTKMLATKMGISRAEAEELARAKAAGSGMQKDYSPQRAYETAVAARIESRSKLDTWQKPDIYQAFPEATSEHDILVLRNLRATDDPTGKMISANRMGYVPYDQKTGEFNYENMLPGAFYYDPRIRAFVQRVPDDPETPEDESGYFKYDKNTFQKSKI